MQYVENHPTVNKLQLVSYSVFYEVPSVTHQSVKLAQVAAGCNYLHHKNVIHADIRGVSPKQSLDLNLR